MPKPKAARLGLLTLLLVTLWYAGSSLKEMTSTSSPSNERPAEAQSQASASLMEAANQHMEAALATVKAIRDPLIDAEQAQTAPSTPDTAPEVDSDWGDLQRTRFSFGWWVSTLSPNMDADLLFRHERLNPTDTYIRKDDREILTRFLEQLSTQLAALDTVTGQIGANEAEEFLDTVPHTEIATTHASTIDAQGGDHALSVIPRLSEPSVILTRDGKMYAIPTRSLPGLRAVHERRAFLTLEVGYGIGSWFRSLGLLSEPQFNEVMKGVSDWAEGHRALAQPK